MCASEDEANWVSFQCSTQREREREREVGEGEGGGCFSVDLQLWLNPTSSTLRCKLVSETYCKRLCDQAHL
jgi:hypothetical protein